MLGKFCLYRSDWLGFLFASIEFKNGNEGVSFLVLTRKDFEGIGNENYFSNLHSDRGRNQP